MDDRRNGGDCWSINGTAGYANVDEDASNLSAIAIFIRLGLRPFIILPVYW